MHFCAAPFWPVQNLLDEAYGYNRRQNDQSRRKVIQTCAVVQRAASPSGQQAKSSCRLCLMPYSSWCAKAVWQAVSTTKHRNRACKRVRRQVCQLDKMS